MSTKESFDALLESIRTCKSLTVIDYKIEITLADDQLSVQQRADLQVMHDLDNIWAFASEKLGMQKEADAIRALPHHVLREAAAAHWPT